ncbi:MAG: YigZ family protein [Saprospiraceae bacterium]|nr:YigZ family protein [Saprospiraceae bacterium]
MKSPDAYKTIAGQSEGEFKDKGSKFFAYLKFIDTTEGFSDFLNEIKSKHFKARHHCFAYRLLNKDIFRYADDGEPSGTAGLPIYNQILSADLVNVGCIVVRYFGGTKLGTSGLINAYKLAAKDAIIKANILNKHLEAYINIAFDYGLMGNLLKCIKYLDLDIKETDYNASPNLTLVVKRSEGESAVKKIKAYMLNRSIEDIDDDTKIEGLVFGIDI